MEIRPHDVVLGLGVVVPSVDEWASGAILVADDGEVLALEHQWPPSEAASNDPYP